jgi:ribonuclease BN (tRNA processing enzyme)
MAAAYAGCTTLVHEATFGARSAPTAVHCRTTDAGRAAREAGARRLIAVHLGPTAFVPVEQVREEIAAEYDGEIVIPQDGATYAF